MGIRKALTFLLSLAMPLAAVAQQPQTSTDPIYHINSAYTNGVAPGYWPQAGAGLVLNIGKGTVNCANTMTAYAGGTLTMANNTTNYVYLDTAASCAPASNTSGFTSTKIPIATVVTLSGVITTVTDDRTPFTTVAAGGTVTGSGTNPKIAIWATGTSLGNIGTPTLCTTGQAPTGIDANGNATGCAAFGSGTATKVCSQVAIAMPTGAISNASKSSAVTGTCTGLTTADTVTCQSSVEVFSVTGFDPTTTTSILTIGIWPTADTIHAEYGNKTGVSVTPGALTINCSVWR